jgi:hypothetical protein
LKIVSPWPLRSALIDMFLLSHCDEVLLTGGSTFGEFGIQQKHKPSQVQHVLLAERNFDRSNKASVWNSHERFAHAPKCPAFFSGASFGATQISIDATARALFKVKSPLWLFLKTWNLIATWTL